MIGFSGLGMLSPLVCKSAGENEIFEHFGFLIGGRSSSPV
jgi:hypothetical protein